MKTLIDEKDLKIIKSLQENVMCVPIVKLCKEFGINVYMTNTETGISGAIIEKDNIYTIYVNMYEPRTRQRFTVAHELSHFLLHKDKIQGNLTDMVSTINTKIMYRSRLSNGIEAEANQLASEILMPNTLIDKYLENGVNTYKELADRLEVSESALRKRLKNLHTEYLL